MYTSVSKDKMDVSFDGLTGAHISKYWLNIPSQFTNENDNNGYLDIMVHTCNPNIRTAEARELH